MNIFSFTRKSSLKHKEQEEHDGSIDNLTTQKKKERRREKIFMINIDVHVVLFQCSQRFCFFRVYLSIVLEEKDMSMTKIEQDKAEKQNKN